MHDDAGHRRRRRILLLHIARSTSLPELPSPADVPAPAPELCVDDDYVASLGPGPVPVLLIEDTARRPLREQPISGPILRLGRGPDNDLRLNHERIQSRQLVLLRLPGGVFYIKASPEAEVLGPKEPVESGWYTSTLCLRTGPFRLRLNGVRKGAPNFDPLAVSPVLTAELPRLELKFLGSTVPNRPWMVTRPLTLIGRSPVCRIRLDHGRILPVQAAIVRHGGRCWLINFGAPEQVCCNDEPTASALLDVGDTIRLGDFRMEVHAAAEWPEPAATPAAPPPTAAAPPADLEGLLRQFADQHQKILETQQAALDELSRLAGATTDPAELRGILEKIQASYAALGRGQSEMQARLQMQLKRPAE